MKSMFKIATILGLTFGGAGMAFAQEDLDANGDGVFSFAEMMVGFPEMSEETFIAIDSNGDGLIDPTEYAAGVEAGLIVTES